MTGPGAGVNRPAGIAKKKAGLSTGLSFDCSTVSASLPRECGHDADEDARLVVADVARELLGATRIRARELPEDREVAGGEVALDGVVEDLVAVDVLPVVTPRITRVERQREFLADR